MIHAWINIFFVAASRYPSQLTISDITYKLAPDYREGYLENVVLNISWNKPRGEKWDGRSPDVYKVPKCFNHSHP